MLIFILHSVSAVVSSCDASCATCDVNLICLTCIASNAYPVNTECLCNDGYYQAAALTLTNACEVCHPHCLTCTDNVTCATCKVPTANPALSIGCECNLMTYLSGSLSSITGACLSCPDTCYTCDSFEICTECFDWQSYLGTDFKCYCNEGYYWEMGEGMVCSNCYTECSTCEDYYSCLSCVVEFSVPSPTPEIYCECQTGFMSILEA